MWKYRPLDNARMGRLVTLLRPHMDDGAIGLEFLLSLGADDHDLAELLSILTGQTPEWVRQNYRLASAVKVLKEFEKMADDLTDRYFLWRMTN